MLENSTPERAEHGERSSAGSTPGSPTPDVVVIGWDAPTESERRALEIALFMGASVQWVPLAGQDLPRSATAAKLVPRCACMIVQAETLAKLAGARPAAELRGLLAQAGHAFIYGFQPQARHDAILQALSLGKLLGTCPLAEGDAPIQVAANDPEWGFHFSGLSIRVRNPVRKSCFLEGDAPAAALIRIGKQPFLVRSANGPSQLFFLASGEFADLDEKVPRQASALQWFCDLVPLMIFLRGALKDRVWHSDQAFACFVIDDPLLKVRHGFLEYQRLFDSVSRQKFSPCIAFIPWNYRRSSREVAKLFSSHRDAAFLCVHGCDHTDAEFESTDLRLLGGKASLALERMHKHRELAGVPFDEVMVFPQGLFSAEAVAALHASGYVAAVNTELAPSTMPEALELRELLDVAVSRFDGFPIFGRHYPKDLAEFAFDLFLGKPAIMVEHHGYFRDGYCALESFVAGLNTLDTHLEWGGLESICSRACLRKILRNGLTGVRFYSNRFRLQNGGARSQTYELVRSWPAHKELPVLTRDGREQHCERDENGLKMQVALTPGQATEIRLLAPAADSFERSARNHLLYNLSVGVRRVLCEFRDNYVDTNPVARRFLAGVK